MEHSFLQLNDLPDELLMIIFKNMKLALALYSLMGINRRFDRILRDSIFVSHLALMTRSSNGFIYPMYKKTIDRFCSHILPQVHYNVKWLNLEALSMEPLLLATDYPNLEGLGLYNILEGADTHFFTGTSSLVNIFKNQISKLVITVFNNKPNTFIEDLETSIFLRVFTIFPNLHYLNFQKFFETYKYIKKPVSFNWELNQIFPSSNLKELHVNLKHFNDCLYLLDDRLNQLEKLYVHIEMIFPHPTTINDKKKLFNLKCFSLTSDIPTSSEDDLIIPLLHRMTNLESLGLYIIIYYFGKTKFIDGNYLKKNIVDHLPHLNKFMFNIRSSVLNPIDLPSNDDIQHTFKNFQDIQVISCVDYFKNKTFGQCLIYSYPYTMERYEKITNNFSGGSFKCVCEISLFDERPFEDEFFLRISQAFPFLKILSLRNIQPQQHKQFQRSQNEKNQDYSIINYSHLRKLDLWDAHDDYAELFLDHTKTCLANKITLRIEYGLLERVTHHFTRETTQFNCAKMNNLVLQHQFQITDQFIAYFPLVNLRTISYYYSNAINQRK